MKGPGVLVEIGGLETNRINQLVVRATLQTTRDPAVFAIGDCAECPRPSFPRPVPPRAQAAHQQASHMLRQLTRRLEDKSLEAFTYRDFDSLVSPGKYSTVGSLVGRSMFIKGYFARVMYRSLYRMHQAALHGSGPVLWRTLAGLLSRRPDPEVKLH